MNEKDKKKLTLRELEEICLSLKLHIQNQKDLTDLIKFNNCIFDDKPIETKIKTYFYKYTVKLCEKNFSQCCKILGSDVENIKNFKKIFTSECENELKIELSKDNVSSFLECVEKKIKKINVVHVQYIISKDIISKFYEGFKERIDDILLNLLKEGDSEERKRICKNLSASTTRDNNSDNFSSFEQKLDSFCGLRKYSIKILETTEKLRGFFYGKANIGDLITFLIIQLKIHPSLFEFYLDNKMISKNDYLKPIPEKEPVEISIRKKNQKKYIEYFDDSGEEFNPSTIALLNEWKDNGCYKEGVLFRSVQNKIEVENFYKEYTKTLIDSIKESFEDFKKKLIKEVKEKKSSLFLRLLFFKYGPDAYADDPKLNLIGLISANFTRYLNKEEKAKKYLKEHYNNSLNLSMGLILNMISLFQSYPPPEFNTGDKYKEKNEIYKIYEISTRKDFPYIRNCSFGHQDKEEKLCLSLLNYLIKDFKELEFQKIKNYIGELSFNTSSFNKIKLLMFFLIQSTHSEIFITCFNQLYKQEISFDDKNKNLLEECLIKLFQIDDQQIHLSPEVYNNLFKFAIQLKNEKKNSRLLSYILLMISYYEGAFDSIKKEKPANLFFHSALEDTRLSIFADDFFCAYRKRELFLRKVQSYTEYFSNWKKTNTISFFFFLYELENFFPRNKLPSIIQSIKEKIKFQENEEKFFSNDKNEQKSIDKINQYMEEIGCGNVFDYPKGGLVKWFCGDDNKSMPHKPMLYCTFNSQFTKDIQNDGNFFEIKGIVSGKNSSSLYYLNNSTSLWYDVWGKKDVINIKEIVQKIENENEKVTYIYKKIDKAEEKQYKYSLNNFKICSSDEFLSSVPSLFKVFMKFIKNNPGYFEKYEDCLNKFLSQYPGLSNNFFSNEFPNEIKEKLSKFKNN